MPQFMQIHEVDKLNGNIEQLVKKNREVANSGDKNMDLDIPPQVRKVLDEKNAMISRMREEILTMKENLGLPAVGVQQSLSEEIKMAASIDLDASDAKNEVKNSRANLEKQEQRILQAQKENEEAEKETEYKIKHGWQDETEDEIFSLERDSDHNRRSASIEQLSRLVKRELEISDQLDRTILSLQDEREGMTSSMTEADILDSRLDSLSHQIVEKLLTKMNTRGYAVDLQASDHKQKEEVKVFDKPEEAAEVNGVLDKLNGPVEKKVENKAKEKREIERLKFQLEQEKFNSTEIQTAIKKEREQALNWMENLNQEKSSRIYLEDQMEKCQEEMQQMETQLLRHREEIEELTSLYEAEKQQNSTLEEALASEKLNFNKLVASLDKERQRSREVSIRDTDTILELRTALEVEKEKGSRLTLESPVLGRKSLCSSRHSLPGFRSPGLPDIAMEKSEDILEELTEERDRCDRLKECLEIERERFTQLEQSSQMGIEELMEQLSSCQESLEKYTRKCEASEADNIKLQHELKTARETFQRLSQEMENMELKLQKKRTESREDLMFDAFYVEDLESKVEAYRSRETELEDEISTLKKRLSKERASREGTGFQLCKSGSFAAAAKHLPPDPQEQAIYFYRLLLRAESYRKALVWQKKYLSLLLSSYQESEMIALGRLARMSGSRRTLITDKDTSNRSRPTFRTVVIACTAIHRMKFLVKRWRKTRRSPKRSTSVETGLKSNDRIQGRQETLTLSPQLDFSRDNK